MMIPTPLPLLLLFALALAAGCTAPGAALVAGPSSSGRPLPPDRPRWLPPRVEATGFFERTELNEVDFEDAGIDVDMPVDRRRAGVRLAVGNVRVQGFVQVFGERFLRRNEPGLAVFGLTDDFDLGGIGGGVRGDALLLGRPGKESPQLLLPYRLQLAAVGGEDDRDNELSYGQVTGELGLATELAGFRPSAGVVAEFLAGEIEPLRGPFETIEFGGSNVGGFAELAYRHPNPRVPLYLAVRGVLGHVRSFGVSLGWAP